MLEEIISTIKKHIEDAEVQILDPRRDGVHLEAIVVSQAFENQSLVKQHRMVMEPLQELFATSLHALALKTYTPKAWEALNDAR